MSVLVVGTVAYDTVHTADASRERILGGSATYFSLAASGFTDVRIVAVVGEDFGDEQLATFAPERIDIRGIERMPGEKTFFWEGRYSPDFTERTTLDTQLNVFEKFSPKLNGDYRNTPVIFLANALPKLQSQVLDQAQAARFVACDTMNLWIETMRDDLMQVLKRVQLLLINDEESYLLTGDRNIHVAAQKILDMGPEYLIIKRGEFGCALYSRNETFLLPAYPITRVVDPTGAGDSFAGGLMGYLAGCDTISFEEIKRAVVMGTVTASYTVEAFSVERLARLTHPELGGRVDEFKRVTGWELS